MYRRSEPFQRRGTTLVESALVYSVTMLLTLGVLVIGLGVYRYQQVAALCGEGARYACVHGGQWALDKNGGTLTTQSDVKTAITPMAVGLDTSQFTSTPPNPAVTWDDSLQKQTTSGGQKNYVTVTVTYQWSPELYIVGPVSMRSTSRMLMQY